MIFSLTADLAVPADQTFSGGERFEIILSPSDYKHLIKLDNYLSSADFKSYNAENDWRAAKLKVGENAYKITFKVHGRTPISLHKMGRFWSLSLKLKGKHSLFGYRRFSLITSNRLTDKMFVPERVAEKKGLISHVHYPAWLAFNNTTVEKVYVENKFDDQFFEFTEKPEYRLFSYPYFQYAPETSMIYTGYHVLPQSSYDFGNLETIFTDIFLKREATLDSNSGILDRYFQINKAIISNEYQQFEKFFDLEYLARYEAARAALGLNGHGSLNDNLHVFYNTSNGKFYPGLTRDHKVSALTSFKASLAKTQAQESLESFTDFYLGDYRLFIFAMISQNNALRQAKYTELYRMIKSGELLNVFSGDIRTLLESNYAALKQYLERSNTDVMVSAHDTTLSIKIMPASMSALNFSKLVVPASGRSRVEWGIMEGGRRLVQGTRYFSSNERSKDISNILGDFIFFTALDQDLNKKHNEYFLEINYENDFAASEVQYEIRSVVTGKMIKVNSLLVESTAESEPPAVKQNVANPFFAYSESLGLLIEGKNVIVPRGEHTFLSDVILPEGYHLVFEAGASIRLGGGVSIVSRCGLTAIADEAERITVTAKVPNEPFGVVGVQGCPTGTVDIANLLVDGGAEAWIDGAFYSGALSIYNVTSVDIEGLEVINSVMDDGLNIKNAIIKITASVFEGNAFDQVDLDNCSGIVDGNAFLFSPGNKIDGDGLDVSFSELAIINNKFRGSGDKGISVGERSRVALASNEIALNNIGVAVKDSSKVLFLDNEIRANEIDFSLYQKKSIFSGGQLFIDTSSSFSVESDRRSKIQDNSSLIHLMPPHNATPALVGEAVSAIFD